MGAGKKPQKSFLGEKNQQSSSQLNNYRNLRKNDLGGVIFGCTHQTMKECLSNQIFGLPSQHFVYIKNVEPGLPLFLFNYSDRKLHGIFEAASEGKMNINPYGWSGDGSERTQYPAQVCIRIRMKCQPLPEKQFSPIISDNYFVANLFWFELDHAQASGLISLFESSPTIGSSVSRVPKDAPKWKPLSKTIPGHDKIHESKDLLASISKVDNVPSAYFKMQSGFAHEASKSKSLCSMNPNHDARNEDEGSKAVEFPCLDQSNVCVDKENHMLKPHSDKKVVECEEQRIFNKLQQLSLDRERPKSCPNMNPDHDARNDDESSKAVEFPCLDQFNKCVDEENQILEPHSDKEVVENEQQLGYNQLALDTKCSKTCPNGHEEDVDVPHVKNDTPIEDDCSPEAPLVSSDKYEEISVNPSYFQSFVNQLRQEVGELKALSLDQLQKTTSLEKKLMKSEIQVQQLKGQVQQLRGHVKHLESQLSPSTTCVDAPLNDLHVTNRTSREPFDDMQLGVDELVFIIGGFDGISWLSALDCYSPSRDMMKSLKPMSSARSYASSTALNGDIYIFGGGDGSSWYNTAESYNPLRNEWTSLPSLLEKKGSLAGATLHSKVYAIGGGNGIDCFSDVEMFDPALGRWIRTQSMLQKRFSPAVAELNGVIYAVGGFDGFNYLRSAERFDPREVSWSGVQGMNTRRGCPSLAVLNEKLYALGGYDGDSMVPSVEVFDPRIGTWMMADDEMKAARGFSVSAVIGETIYVIGGLCQGNILDTVECYKEGQGWELTNLKGVGKRCFFTAVVL